MNKLCYLIILFLTCRICIAQNLVPNGDFEIYGIVPCGWTSGPSVFNAATSGWTSPTNATPDIHSTLIAPTCSNYHPNSTYSGCTNGSQLPHSGNIFAGFYTYNVPYQYREYIQAQLSAPMIPGVTYKVELYVSLGEKSQFATNNIGVGFSTTFTNTATLLSLGYTPQVLFTNVVSDSINWVLLKDTITPSQPYEYIIIGNFFNDSATNIVSVNPGTCWDRTYYYCDDVSISVDSTVGINEIKGHTSAILYPNPVNEKLTITMSNNEYSEIILYDIASRELLQQTFTNSVTINTEQLAKGIYIYEMRNKNKVIEKGKIVKE